jgi:FKBP-type peptidyl-prolyl cis-trans isomerase 2
MKYVLALICVALVLGCTGAQNSTTNTANSLLAVKIGDNVSVDYMGMFENGTVFDSSIGRAPMDFVIGRNETIRGFENAVIGMREGEEKNVTIKPEDAYGLPDPKLVFEVSKTMVPNSTKAGDTLYSGKWPVRVLEVRNSTVVIDANSDLAGKTLVFYIKVVRINP